MKCPEPMCPVSCLSKADLADHQRRPHLVPRLLLPPVPRGIHHKEAPFHSLDRARRPLQEGGETTAFEGLDGSHLASCPRSMGFSRAPRPPTPSPTPLLSPPRSHLSAHPPRVWRQECSSQRLTCPGHCSSSSSFSHLPRWEAPIFPSRSTPSPMDPRRTILCHFLPHFRPYSAASAHTTP